MKRFFIFSMAAATLLGLHLLTAAPPLSPASSWSLNIGVPDVNAAHLGYGWSVPERGAGRHFTWMINLEADIVIECTAPEARTIELLYHHAPHARRNQRVGVFVNHRLAAEWVIPRTETTYAWHRFDVPATLWREGRNTITLRVGMLNRASAADKRKLGLMVDRLVVSPVAPAPANAEPES